jgi:phosphoglycerate dehydrogenase-like enzyme
VYDASNAASADGKDFSMSKPRILVTGFLPEGQFERLQQQWPDCIFLDGRGPAGLDEHLATATIACGLPPLARLSEAASLRWIQLLTAGVPQELCPLAQARGLTVTNLSGLYGPTIAEHALCLMTLLARSLHTALRNQADRRWDRGIASTMADLHGKTVAVVGLGDIGRAIARLARAYGMRVVGCRRTDAETPDIDQVYPCRQLLAMLAEADHVVVAAPLTTQTEGLLGRDAFAAIKRGVIYINVSRGRVAEEASLLHALQSGQVAAAGLDVFAAEPLPADHPFWAMPQVVVSPHYSGETVNRSDQPGRRFSRNLAAWLANRPFEGLVDPRWGY